MDVSGGSGQPRSGNDEPAEHPAGPTAPTTGPTPQPGPEPRSDAPGTGRPEDARTRRPAEAADTQDASGRPAAASSTEAAPDPAGTPRHSDSTGTGTGDDPHTRTTGDDGAPGETTGTPGDADAEDSSGGTEPAGAHTDDPTGGPRPADTARTTGTPTDTPGTAHDPHSDHRSLAHAGIAKGEPPQPRPKEPGGGILMGRPFGVPVYVAPSWFLVAALITWVFGGQLDRVLPELGAARYLVSLFFAVAFYASVLVHELAHTVAAIRFKLPVRRIQLQFFGGVSEIEKEAETPGREFVLAFVGPLLSLVLAGLFYLAMKLVEPGTVPGVLLAGLMISNLIVAIFNLLPGLPLDGGRMLRAVVWKITGKPMSGTVAAAWVGRALAVTVLIGLPLLNQSGALGGDNTDAGGMDTVTDALLAAILAAIIWTGAGNSLRMARLREHLPELRARTLTRRAVPVETDTPLSEALRRANAAGARALVVVDAHGNPLSLVRESAIVGVPEHRRPWVAVSGLAQELTDGMRVSAELAGEELLDVLRATPATEYLVVEESGEIFGVLSAADVERAFVRAMARPA
ncbi:peptidase [Streptomyces yokosukanensis]|uniref:Peptidase n=1 Tax=Streptomyces yokosukanensis TaxID=67386 RepID=A0A101NVB9_9ACTN|nr:site-2 protease family protein [Streptomyces yokosukanensis]KUN00034.1 peptidase [Streptomyces yokosukanensis]